jgi:hypothetical protein
VLGLRAAVRAECHLAALHVDVTREIDLVDLLANLPQLRIRLHPGQLLLQLGGVAHAQAVLLVPADLVADPLPALVTLLEVRLHLLDGLGERLVLGLRLGEVLGLLTGPPDVREAAAAEQPAETPGHLAAHADRRSLEARLVAVAASLAEELELVAGLGRVIGVVVGVTNLRHVWFLPCARWPFLSAGWRQGNSPN